jgi:hypothetical protein
VGGVLPQHVGVELGVAGAAEPVLERHPHPPTAHVVAVGAVVVPAHPNPVGLQVADADLEGVSTRLGDLPPDPITTTGGQQGDAVGAGEAVVERLHPLVDPLAPVLPGLVEPLPVQRARIGPEDLAAQPLHRLDLDPPGAAELARALHRAHVALERLGPGELLQIRDALLAGPLL